jgi:hypothetical protein
LTGLVCVGQGDSAEQPSQATRGLAPSATDEIGVPAGRWRSATPRGRRELVLVFFIVSTINSLVG